MLLKYQEFLEKVKGRHFQVILNYSWGRKTTFFKKKKKSLSISEPKLRFWHGVSLWVFLKYSRGGDQKQHFKSEIFLEFFLLTAKGVFNKTVILTIQKVFFMTEGSWKSKSETLVDFPPGFSEYKGKATHFRAENVTKENCSIIRKFLVAYITVE